MNVYIKTAAKVRNYYEIRVMKYEIPEKPSFLSTSTHLLHYTHHAGSVMLFGLRNLSLNFFQCIWYTSFSKIRESFRAFSTK